MIQSPWTARPTRYGCAQVLADDGGPNDFNSQVDRSFANLPIALRGPAFGASPPASSLIPVPVLFADGVPFEIDAVAVGPRSGRRRSR